jgi:AcrR family transcriptional regulator
MATKTREGTASAEVDTATRERILLEASRLFRHHGYAATTLREVADAAGIKAGSIYYHFEGKEEIAARVLDAGIQALTHAVQHHRAALPPAAGLREHLAAAVQGHLWGMLHNGDFTAAHSRIYRHVSDAARARHKPVRMAYTRMWDELLAQAAAAGAVRRDVPVALIRQFLVGALNWPVDWYDPERGSFERFAHQITALVFDGIALGPEATH